MHTGTATSTGKIRISLQDFLMHNATGVSGTEKCWREYFRLIQSQVSWKIIFLSQVCRDSK